MKLWITGKNGLLGSALCPKADLSTGKELDISDYNALKAFATAHPGITHIVNCAAYSLVDQAEQEKEEAMKGNGIGPGNLARLAKEIDAKFVHISTDYIFDGQKGFPLKETDIPSPLNHYAITKLEGEKRALQENPSSCILRTSWVFGSGGKNFVAKLLELLQTQEQISLSDDQWGRPTYVMDLVEAISHLWDQSGIYHFANQGETNKYLFGCAMRELALEMGFPIRCKKIIGVPSHTFPSPCKRPTYSAFDTQKIEQSLTIRPWQEGLKEFLWSKSALFSVS